MSKTLIVAVSGGVDSVVLLDMLMKHTCDHINSRQAKIVVAHVDHGIRADSADDAQFVHQLSKTYQLAFHSTKLNLGPKASEEQARNQRYAFLRQVQAQYPDAQIVTAHHKNDVVETMILNILRGTGWRGLCSLRSDSILRPLLAMSKHNIYEYAKTHDLEWREDRSNQNLQYLRNKIRRSIMPRCSLDEWFDLYQKQCALRKEIESEITQLTTTARYPFIVLPLECAIEILQQSLRVTRSQTYRALQAIKTAKAGTSHHVGNKVTLRFSHRDFQIEM